MKKGADPDMSPEPLESPVARAIEYAPVWPRFPRVSMTRRQAIEDILIVFVVLLTFAIVTHVADLHSILEELMPSGGPYGWVLLNGLLALSSIALVLKLRNQGPAELGLNRISAGVFLLSVLAAVPSCYMVGLFCTIGATALSGENLVQMAQERSSFLAYISDIPVNWIVPVVLFVGWYEEILFRGFFLPRLLALLPGTLLPIAVCSVVFGLLHFQQGLPFMAQITGVAVVLTILVVKTSSLWPAIATHAAIDGLSLLAAIKVLPYLQKVLESVTSAPTTMP